MAWQIGDDVVRGELNNSRRNSVSGWLDFGGQWGIRLELTGNFQGDLAGRHIRFQTARPDDDLTEQRRDELEPLETQQIGVTGIMQLRFDSAEQAADNVPAEPDSGKQDPCTAERKGLYLEWYSQNGHIIADVTDAEIEDIADQELDVPPALADAPPDETGSDEELSFLDQPLDAEGQPIDEDADDPYGLFPADLDDELELANASDSDGLMDDESLGVAPTSESSTDPPDERSWDEVIPDIDPRTKALHEEWDEFVTGNRDEPLATLFDPPLQLPPAASLSESAAEERVRAILSQLAQYCVAIDVCEHFSALDTYRYLIEEILPSAQIHPELRTSGFVQHYSTWESCPQCEAEFEADCDDP